MIYDDEQPLNVGDEVVICSNQSRKIRRMRYRVVGTWAEHGGQRVEAKDWQDRTAVFQWPEHPESIRRVFVAKRMPHAIKA